MTTPRQRLGVIAPEFPPDLGGMAELARGLVAALAATDDVTAYVFPEHGLETGGVASRPVLTGRLARDARSLAGADVDAWLALNAGLVPLARGLEQPFFAYFHGNDFLSPWLACGGDWLERLRRPYCAPLRHRLRRAAIRRHTSAVRRIFTNSSRTAGLIEERLGVEGTRIQIAPPGVDDAFFQQRTAADPAALRLLTVSRLSRYTPRKNVDGVLRAVARLNGRVPIRYTVVGDGDDRPRLEALAESLGIAERVRFTGRVDKAELLAAYTEADLFILASRAGDHDVEGFGIVYMEASATGVPVLLSREGGAVDALVDGANGMLLPSSSDRDIAGGIERFYRRRNRFPPEQVRAVAERYRWPAIAASIRGAIASDRKRRP